MRLTIFSLLIPAALLIAGCSGAGNSSMEVPDVSPDASPDALNETPPLVQNPVSDSSGDTVATENSIRIDFDITVPAYQSDALQLELTWGEKTITGVWNSDELWTASAEFPANSTNLLRVTFADQNGGIILASFETNFDTNFDTGEGATEPFEITADQFETAQWDDDNDGVSNFDQLSANATPPAPPPATPPGQVNASLELVADKTFRISWQPTVGVEYYRVLENPNRASGFQQVGGEIESSALFYDHRVALFNSANASYMVQACNDTGCSDSNEVFIDGTIDKAVGYFKAPYADPEPGSQFGSALAISENGETMAVTGSHEVHVFKRVDGSWLLQASLYENMILGDGGFGNALSISANGDTLAIGSPEEPSITDGNISAQVEFATRNAGAVYIYKRELDNWRLQSVVRADNTEARDFFGISVSLNGEGTVLAVGAEGESSQSSGINGDANDNSLTNSGAAYVFAVAGERWQQQAYLKAGNPDETDKFGGAVSLSEDGRTLAVGAIWQDLPGDDTVLDGGTSGAGAVYVFHRNDASWQEQALLKADNPDEEDQFGYAVSLSATGDVLAVGAPQYNLGNGNTFTFPPTGAAYLFERSNNTWQQSTRLRSTIQGYKLGTSVDISRDGRMLAVGVPGYYNLTTQFPKSGAAFIYRDDGVNWQLETTLQSATLDSGDGFGRALSLSADAKTLVIGAANEDSKAIGFNNPLEDRGDNSAKDSGAVFLY